MTSTHRAAPLLAIPLALALIFSMARAQEADSPVKPADPKPAPKEPAGPAKPDMAGPPGQTPGDPEGQAKPPASENPKANPPAPGSSDGFRDPTATPEALRRLTDGPAAVSPASVTRLPKVELKARIIAAGRAPAALISIENQITLVRKGSEITIDGSSSLITTIRGTDPSVRNIVLKVIELDAEVLIFEVLATRQTIQLR